MSARIHHTGLREAYTPARWRAHRDEGYQNLLRQAENIHAMGRPWEAVEAPELSALLHYAETIAEDLPLNARLPRRFKYLSRTFVLKVTIFGRVMVCTVGGRELAVGAPGAVWW